MEAVEMSESFESSLTELKSEGKAVGILGSLSGLIDSSVIYQEGVRRCEGNVEGQERSDSFLEPLPTTLSSLGCSEASHSTCTIL